MAESAEDKARRLADGAEEVRRYLEALKAAEGTECVCTPGLDGRIEHAGCKVWVAHIYQRREQSRRHRARKRKERDAAQARRDWWTPERRAAKAAAMRATMKTIWREWYEGKRPTTARQVLWLKARGMWPQPETAPATVSAAVVYAAPAASSAPDPFHGRPWPRPKPLGKDYAPGDAALLRDLAAWDADAWAAAQGAARKV